MQLLLVHYSLSLLFMIHDWLNHLFHSYGLHLGVDDRKDYQMHLLLCTELHHCHTSRLICLTGGIRLSVTVWDLVFSHQMLPSGAWYWNTMTRRSPPDDLFDTFTPLVDSSASRSQVLRSNHLGYYHHLNLILSAWNLYSSPVLLLVSSEGTSPSSWPLSEKSFSNNPVFPVILITVLNDSHALWNDVFQHYQRVWLRLTFKVLWLACKPRSDFQWDKELMTCKCKLIIQNIWFFKKRF